MLLQSFSKSSTVLVQQLPIVTMHNRRRRLHEGIAAKRKLKPPVSCGTMARGSGRRNSGIVTRGTCDERGLLGKRGRRAQGQRDRPSVGPGMHPTSVSQNFSLQHVKRVLFEVRGTVPWWGSDTQAVVQVADFDPPVGDTSAVA